MHKYPMIPYKLRRVSPEEMIEKSRIFYQRMNKRRSVRAFSAEPVPRKVIENVIKTASTAPSGAHKQPWTFCAVSSAELKAKIREAAEKEEYASYNGRLSKQWLRDLAPLGTDWHKPFLESAPWLIIVFRRIYEEVNGEKHNNYYVGESVGLACGFLLTALHEAGLAALTHTPSPMNFLSDLLKRPDNERPFLLIPVGFPASGAQVPDLTRKKLDEIAVFYE